MPLAGDYVIALASSLTESKGVAAMPARLLAEVADQSVTIDGLLGANLIPFKAVSMARCHLEYVEHRDKLGAPPVFSTPNGWPHDAADRWAPRDARQDLLLAAALLLAEVRRIDAA